MKQPAATSKAPTVPREIRVMSSLREQQRVAHLVLGLERPIVKVTLGKRSGRRKSTTKMVPATLEPGIEEHVSLRERWSHKHAGHPETHDQAARRQQGALTRLFAKGTIDRDQLASAEQISDIYEAIGSAVSIRSSFASLTRVDGGKAVNDCDAKLYAMVRGEIAYSLWRSQVAAIGSISAVLEMIVDDIALTEVARRYRIHNRRARQLLIDALNLWPRCLGTARKKLGDVVVALDLD